MSKLLRYYAKGNIYFVTSVTNNREPFLEDNYSILVDIFKEISIKLEFELIAYVVMPDHFHLLIDPKENDLSDIIKRIKIKFAYQYRKKNNLYRKTVWQKRFWDHIIRDQEDLNKHIDYIHYNPIKHLKIKSPFDWAFSSIHNYKEYYLDDWGVNDELLFDGDFGE